MARPPRVELAGGIHHVWARGNRKQLVFEDDEDCDCYLALLGVVVKRKWWRILSYSLMRNHIHLLVETPKTNLGDGMRYLQGRYALEFNRRHDRIGHGHLWQGRYRNKLVRSDDQLYNLAAYIARNPVVAGLSPRADGWRWSSHATIAADATPWWLDTERLGEFFGSIDRYQAFVDQFDGETSPLR